MTVAYFDCFSGIAGDMVLGALLDLGADFDSLKEEIKKLGLSGYRIDVKKTLKKDILATDVSISYDSDQPHRTYKDIQQMITNCDLESSVKLLSQRIFLRLAEAEAMVHGVDVDRVHFHEVGAIDSIIDIVGSVICLNQLGVTDVFSSSLPLGSGFVDCQHGRIPVPSPATVELVKDVPTYQLDSGHEMVTPTGAAIITTLAKGFGEIPRIKVLREGYGAGKIKSDLPGVLRVLLGENSQG